MKLADIKKLANTSSKENTTNGWGFGGWYGTKFSFNDGIDYLNGRWSSRRTDYAYKLWKCGGVEIKGNPQDNTWEVLEVFYAYPDIPSNSHTFVWFNPNEHEIPELANISIPHNTTLKDFKIRKPFEIK